ncbi:MAG: hypothetical protein J7J96_07630 [Sulfurimonas sp.]|nr:hypothetical protein [Sulfurimonas sp.]
MNHRFQIETNNGTDALASACGFKVEIHMPVGEDKSSLPRWRYIVF